MDLGLFATKENSTNGVWVEPIVFGQESGIELCLLGSDADVVRKHESASMREVQAMTKPQQERVDFAARSRENVVVRTTGIRVKGDVEGKIPVTINGKVVEDTPAGYRFLYEQIPQIQLFSKEWTDNRANFLPKEKTSSSEQSDASSSSTILTASDEGKKDK